MPGASNTSFIPKRNPTKKDKTTTRKQVYVGTLVIRVLFLAVIVASLVLFLYEKKVDRDLESAVRDLDNKIASFNEEEMKQVIAVDKRLRQANSRLQNTASLVSILKAIEESATEATQINSLQLKRTDDNSFAMTLALQAQSFDTVKFQREVFTDRIPVLKNAEVSSVAVENLSEEADFLTSATNEEAEINILFNAFINIEAKDVRYTPLIIEDLNPTPIISNPASDDESDSESSEGSDDNNEETT